VLDELATDLAKLGAQEWLAAGEVEVLNAAKGAREGEELLVVRSSRRLRLRQ